MGYETVEVVAEPVLVPGLSSVLVMDAMLRFSNYRYSMPKVRLGLTVSIHSTCAIGFLFNH